MRALAPAFSAVTYMLLARARRAMFPPPASTTAKDSHVPTAPLLAMSGLAPALSTVTYRLLASALRYTVVPGTSLRVPLGVAVAVAVGGCVGVGPTVEVAVGPEAAPSRKDCAALPLHVHCCSCTASAVEAAGTSRHLPLCRATRW